MGNMRIRGSGCFCRIAALALVGVPLAARGEYAVVDLGALINPPGLSGSGVSGVNLSGQVSITNAPDALNFHAFRYAGGASLDLGTLGGVDSFGHGINNAGQVVGRSKTAADIKHAFVWTPGDTSGVLTNPQMKDLNPTGGASEATAINATGQIAGYVTTRIQNKDLDRAFLYSKGALTQLPLPAGNYAHTYAYGINDSGKVVGEAYTANAGAAHAFIYNGVTSTEIGDFGGGSSSPAAINNNGRVVGYSANTDGYDRAFLYSNGVMSDLGSLGGHYSYANAINNINQIVGGSFTDDADTTFHAFLSDGVSAMIDLTSKVTSKAADWVLSSASGINDRGFIVGSGVRAGDRHGFMLVPLAQGDANADGAVDFLDLAALAQNYNTSGAAAWEHGDFNGDGSVDFLDLAELAQNYNTTQETFQSNVQAAFAAVPEPAAPALLALVSIIGLTGRRRRSHAQ
jgi:probable HAF family extracellular repeat protein